MRKVCAAGTNNHYVKWFATAYPFSYLAISGWTVVMLLCHGIFSMFVLYSDYVKNFVVVNTDHQLTISDQTNDRLKIIYIIVAVI